MPSTTPLSFAKVSSKPTSGITPGRLYFVNSTTANKSNLYLGINSTTLAQIGATIEQGNKADNAVDMSSDQTNILGNKTWKGTQLWNGTTEHRVYSTSTSNDNIEVVGADYNKDESSTSGNYFNTSMQNRFTPTGQYLSVSGNKHNSDLSIYDMPYMSAIYELGFFSAFSRVNLPRISFAITNEGLFNNTFFQYDSSFGVYSSSPLSGAASYFQILHYENYGQTENKLSYDCHGNFSITHNKDYGETTYNFEIIPQNDDYYIGDSSRYGLVSVNNIVNTCVTCFRGDTSYITMSDRSKKLIQDVKQGDMVLSYDVGKREYCEAVVLANVKTGISSAFDTYVFENGATIDVYGGEPLVFEVGGVLTIGDVRDLYRSHSEGDDRRWVLTHTDGAKARVIKKYGSVKCEKAIGRYMLVTSNGLFFVNGLLKGNKAGFISDYYRSRHIEVPANIESILSQVNYKLAEFDNGLEDDKVDAEVLRKMELKWGMIHNAKKYLDATDYKGRKFDEGALTEEEWLPIKEKRAEMRSLINEKEEEINILRESLPDSLKSPTWVRDSEVWIECEGVLNDHLEDFREWQENIKSKRLEDIERRKSEFQQKREELMSKRNKNNKESK